MSPPRSPVGTAIGGALVAETLCGLVLLALLASRRTEIDGVEDGVVYGHMVGLGFALVANVYAYAVAWNGGADAIADEFAGRGIFGPVFQAMFASLFGLGVAYAAARARRRAGRYPAIAAGWIAAVALDALWNHSVTAGGTGLLVTYVILVGVLLATVIAVIADRRRLILMITGLPCRLRASRGGERPMDIRMLASPRLRRLRPAVGAAGTTASPAVRAMTEYQLAATELAMACRRKNLGQTTEDAFLRHRDDSLTLMRAAAALVRAREQLSPVDQLPAPSSVFVGTGPLPPAFPSQPTLAAAAGLAVPNGGTGSESASRRGWAGGPRRETRPRGAAATRWGRRPSRSR